jgi:hypothetical protein
MTDTSARPKTITLQTFYGCCGYDPGSRCDCWCHDPSEGGNNVKAADLEDPEVKAACDYVGNTGRSYPGHVIWADRGPDGTRPGCTPRGCLLGDCVPCLDCGATVHAKDSSYTVDGGGVCVPCGKTRYGDSTEYLLGPMRGYS